MSGGKRYRTSLHKHLLTKASGFGNDVIAVLRVFLREPAVVASLWCAVRLPLAVPALSKVLGYQTAI